MNIDLPLMLLVSLFIGLGIFSQWLANLLKWPAIVVMSIIGLLIGPIIGIVNPQETMGPEIYGTIVSLSVAIILFEGSSNLDTRELLGISKTLRRIMTYGALIGWILGTVALYYIVDFPLAIALVLSALFIVTGPTVIQPLLKQARVTRSVDSILRWESIILDPVGPLIALFVFYGFRMSIEGFSIAILAEYILGLLIAVIIGLGATKLFTVMVKKDMIGPHLIAPMQFVFVLLIFSICDFILHESGLLSVTIFGLGMARYKKRDLIYNESNHFVEQLTMIAVSTVFILITSSLTREMLSFVVSWEVILFCAVMIIIVRPLSIYGSTIGAELNMKERTFLSVVAPRGVVALTVAGFFMEQFNTLEVPMAELILPVTFGLSFITVVIYGFGFKPFSQALGLSSSEPPGVIMIGESPFSLEVAKNIKQHGIPVMISDALGDYRETEEDDGIERFDGNMLSEDDRMYADLTRFEKSLIMTRSTVLNLLAHEVMADEFGVKNVMLLSPDYREGNNMLGSAMHSHILFHDDLSYRKLNQLTKEGNFIEISASQVEELTKNDLVIYCIDEDKHITFKNKTVKLQVEDEWTLGVMKNAIN